MESVGECPELIMELWTNLEIASKYVGERLKIEILLDLLADYDTTKAVSGGDYPSMRNPAARKSDVAESILDTARNAENQRE